LVLHPDYKVHHVHLSGSSSRHMIQTESSLAAADGSHPDGSAGRLNTRTDVPRRQCMLKLLRKEQKLLLLLLLLIIIQVILLFRIPSPSILLLRLLLLLLLLPPPPPPPLRVGLLYSTWILAFTFILI